MVPSYISYAMIKQISSVPHIQIIEVDFFTGMIPLQWRHNGGDGVSSHQPHDRLLNHLFRRRSKKISKLRATDLCAVNSSVTGEFPAQRPSNADNDSIWWRHDDLTHCGLRIKRNAVMLCAKVRRTGTNHISRIDDIALQWGDFCKLHNARG